jgi:hypothetical protein
VVEGQDAPLFLMMIPKPNTFAWVRWFLNEI